MSSWPPGHGNNWWEMGGGKPGTLVAPGIQASAYIAQNLTNRVKGTVGGM